MRSAGRRIREGARVTIAGPTNAGKSSLFNALVGYDRAMVSETPGTTRDVVSEAIDLNGVPVLLADTAGLRDAADTLEREGIRRAEAISSRSDVVLIVLDGSVPPSGADARSRPGASSRLDCVITLSKCDLGESWSPESAGLDSVVRTSARTGQGVGDCGDAL